jgi:protein involved in polysaccharide export with SLBB domain
MLQIILVTALAMLLGIPAGAAGQAAPADPAPGAYADKPLRPGDTVRLRIWREPEMSGDFMVDEDGMVVLPRIGRWQVVDGSAQTLEDRLVRAYEKYLQHTSIDVILLRRVQVLGAVRNPGLYPVDATMTVSDALALAGGATGQGDPDRVELIRRGERIDARLSANTRIAESPIQSGDQLYIPERNWFSRHSGVLAAGMTSLLIAFLTR